MALPTRKLEQVTKDKSSNPSLYDVYQQGKFELENGKPDYSKMGVPYYSAPTEANDGSIQPETPTTPAPTSPGSGSGGNGGGGNYGGGYGGNSATSIYQTYLEQILADQKAAADARQKALEDNYNRAVGLLQQKHNDQVNALNNNANDSMRQAYINYMMNQRGINQQLSNMGINGGATESVLANLYNNYGANRNSIAKELQTGLANLGASYNSGMADLANSYGSNIADVLADYYNQAASAKENYANKIASALATASSSRSSGSGSTTATAEYRPNGLSDGVWNGTKQLIKRYNNGEVDDGYLANYMLGIMSPADAYNVLYENGINPNAVGITLDSATPNATPSVNNNNTPNYQNIQPSAYNEARALNDLKQIRAYARSDEELRNSVNSYLNNLMANGVSEAQAKALFNSVFS